MTAKANGYRLRMIHNQWYLLLEYNNQRTDNALGPFNYKDAQEAAESLQKDGLKDADKG